MNTYSGHEDQRNPTGETYPPAPFSGEESYLPKRQQRRQVRRFLTLWDALIWLLLTLLTEQLGQWSGHPVALLSVKLWVVAGLVGLLLARQPRRHSPLAEQRSALYAPAATLLVGLLLLLVIELPAAWFGELALLCLVWLALMALFRYLQRSRDVPVRLGVLMPARSGRTGEGVLSPAPHPRLVYVPVSANQPEVLSQLDGLLMTPGVPLTPAQQLLVQHAQTLRLPLWSTPVLEEELTGKVTLNLIRRDWLNESSFQSDYLLVKRVLDVTLLVLSLPVLLPLMALVALVVLLNSGRPILFWQERIGQHGKPFRLVKFRTMTRDSEKTGPAFAQQGDLRVTPVGQFLRKFRLDELPQFWNVLRGEMSIIGPRPEQWAFAADFEESIPLYPLRHWVKPGITGWAQVNQGYAANLVETTEKVEYDLYYVKHISIGLDALIVWKTILTILTGFGAR